MGFPWWNGLQHVPLGYAPTGAPTLQRDLRIEGTQPEHSLTIEYEVVITTRRRLTEHNVVGGAYL